MVISGAPVFFDSADKAIMNAVIMQIEVSHGHGDDAKQGLEFSEFKLLEITQSTANFLFTGSFFDLKTDEIRISHRIFAEHHPSVATPPPNFC